MASPSPAVTQAWVALIRAQAAATSAIERALKDGGQPSLEWYDVLWELERAGPLRPRDLEARLLLAQSNLSRLIDRMEAAGVIERRPYPEDRRGLLIRPTARGLDLRREMWTVYGRAIGAVIGARLSEAEATLLASLLTKLRTGSERGENAGAAGDAGDAGAGAPPG